MWLKHFGATAQKIWANFFEEDLSRTGLQKTEQPSLLIFAGILSEISDLRAPTCAWTVHTQLLLNKAQSLCLVSFQLKYTEFSYWCYFESQIHHWCYILSWPPSSAALPGVRGSNPPFSSSIREKLYMNIGTQSQHTEATEGFGWELNHLQTLSCVLHRFSISRCLVARGESFHWLSLFFKSSTVLKTRCRNWLSWQGKCAASTRHFTDLSAKNQGNTEKWGKKADHFQRNYLSS